jgi:hypothetical protein
MDVSVQLHSPTLTRYEAGCAYPDPVCTLSRRKTSCPRRGNYLLNLLFMQSNIRDNTKTKLNSVASVRERIIPMERRPLVGEVSAKFLRIEWCRVVSGTDPHGRNFNLIFNLTFFYFMFWVRERTITTERQRLVGEVIANILRIEGATWSAWRIPTAVSSVF